MKKYEKDSHEHRNHRRIGNSHRIRDSVIHKSPTLPLYGDYHRDDNAQRNDNYLFDLEYVVLLIAVTDTSRNHADDHAINDTINNGGSSRSGRVHTI
jgi:hypothetical protein